MTLSTETSDAVDHAGIVERISARASITAAWRITAFKKRLRAFDADSYTHSIGGVA